MTGSFPVRPDGLVDGTRIPHDALTSEGSCTHERAARVVAHREGCDDVWACPPSPAGCGERWQVAASPTCPPHQWFGLAHVTAPDGTRDTVKACLRCGETNGTNGLAVRHDRDCVLVESKPDLSRAKAAIVDKASRPLVVVPDTTTGPSGLLARFRNRTRKA